jgi:hypothetical protein
MSIVSKVGWAESAHADIDGIGGQKFPTLPVANADAV